MFSCERKSLVTSHDNINHTKVEGRRVLSKTKKKRDSLFPRKGIITLVLHTITFVIDVVV